MSLVYTVGNSDIKTYPGTYLFENPIGGPLAVEPPQGLAGAPPGGQGAPSAGATRFSFLNA